jgi:hypothetical protein
MNGNPFTDEQKDVVKKLYPHRPTKEIAELIQRSEASVYRYANSNGIYKTAEYLASDASGRLNVFCENGKSFRFTKGHVPSNKGQKMPNEMYKKLKPTMFKKGQAPHNTAKENGVISTRKDSKGTSYQFIRISLGNWVPLHQHIWYEANGRYNTSTHCLWFINGNSLDVRLDNLELITRNENVRRNQNKILNLPPELQQTHKLIKKLKTKLKNYDTKI